MYEFSPIFNQSVGICVVIRGDFPIPWSSFDRWYVPRCSIRFRCGDSDSVWWMVMIRISFCLFDCIELTFIMYMWLFFQLKYSCIVIVEGHWCVRYLFMIFFFFFNSSTCDLLCTCVYVIVYLYNTFDYFFLACSSWFGNLFLFFYSYNLQIHCLCPYL